MNRRPFLIVPALILVAIASSIVASAEQKPHSPAAPNLNKEQTGSPPGIPSNPLTSTGSGFTYQGRLTSSGSPANGQFDIRFTLFDDLSVGNQVGSPVTITNQTVSGGLFTVQLDFGSSSFTGDARYMLIEVRPTGGGAFTSLSPRQSITAAPYALSLMPGAVISGTTTSPAVTANNSGGSGLIGTTAVGASNDAGVKGIATGVNGNGVWGEALNGSAAWAVYGRAGAGNGGVFTSISGTGAYGTSTSGIGVYGATSTGTAGGFFTNDTGYSAGYFNANTGTGVVANGGNGIYSTGTVTNGVGLWGVADIGGSAKGVYGTSTSGYGIYGRSTMTNGIGIYGESNTGSNARGVYGFSTSGTGIYGIGSTWTGGYFNGGTTGVIAEGNSYGVIAHSSLIGGYFTSTNGIGLEAVTESSVNPALVGHNISGGIGVYGSSIGPLFSTYGVLGESAFGDGVHGRASTATGSGVRGENSASGVGVYGSSSSGAGGYFTTTTGTGVVSYGGNGTYSTGQATNGVGLWGVADAGSIAKGVYGTSTSGYGVFGVSTASNGTGVYGESNTGTNARGVHGFSSSGSGVYGTSTTGYAMEAAGHAQQLRTAGGWAKATVRVGGASISRCYNSQGASPNVTAPCGFTLTQNAPGDYTIDFGFQVSDRFYSIVPEFAAGTAVIPVVFSFPTVNSLRVRTYSGGSTLVDSAFYVVVY
jgi:hypothetical protein